MVAEDRLSVFVAHPSALLTDHRPYGDGLIALNYLRRLAERGHEIDVAAQEVRIRDPLPANLRIHRLAATGQMGSLRRLVYAVRVRRLHARLCRERSFDLIHQLNPVEVGLTLLLPHDGPVVLGPYPLAWPRSPGSTFDAAAALPRELLRRGLQWLQQRRATLIMLFVSSARRNIRVRRRARLRRPLPRLAIVPPGLDLERFGPAEPPAPPSSPRSVIFLANLERRKGILVLLDAFARVAAQVPDVELVVAGDGSLRDEVAELARSPALAGRVRLDGRVDPRDVPAVLRDASVFCLPSFGEPFGMSALEAMACGLPVVSTNTGGLDELVPAECGLKVPPGDPGALAEALVRILRLPPAELAVMSVAARRTAEAYSWEHALERLEQAYRDALAV